MSHLSPERLAALGEDPPTLAEQGHLARCADCAGERAAYASLADLSRAESVVGLPLTRWDTLAPALRTEGLLAPRRSKGLRRPRAVWLQAAAAVLLVASGMLAGRVSAGASIFGDGTPPMLASDSVPTFASVEEAAAARARYEQYFQAATAFIARHDSVGMPTETPDTYTTRLAALDRVKATVGAALEQAPYDPVLNGYYLDASGQYEATIRQLNTAMPGVMRLTTY